jgi:hypothetical protein
MGRLSDTYAGLLLDAALGSGHVSTFPATVYFALSTTEPADDGTGVTEPSGNGYARVACTNNSTNWPDTGTDRVKALAVDHFFPTPTGSGWGDVGWICLYTASTAGSMVAWVALDSVQTILAGATVRVPAGFTVTAPGS